MSTEQKEILENDRKDNKLFLNSKKGLFQNNLVSNVKK